MSGFSKSDLTGLVGKQLIYTFENGWRYEIYIKNGSTVDYRIHSGIVGGRWVKGQPVYAVCIAEDVYKLSWTEPTGTDVCVTINLSDRSVHGTIFFPRWIINDPQKTVCFQNDHLEQMVAYREAGPAYPTEVVGVFADIIFIRDCKANDDDVISCAASELPDDFPNNLI